MKGRIQRRKLGFEKEALQIIREAIIHNGFWYSYNDLMEDEDLKVLYKYEEFHDIVNLCKGCCRIY